MGKIITVSTTAEIYAALKTATGGETILLKSGSYGSFNLSAKSYFDITFPSNVTIASADSAHPAVFTGLALNGVENLTIKDVVFDYTYKAGEPVYVRPFAVNGSSNVTITGSTFDGDVASGLSAEANGYGYGIGLSVRGSTNVTISDNEFFSWHRGLVVSDSAKIAVTGNEVHDMRSDGMDFSGVQGVRIEDNYLHDFRASYASGDHRDMIQFWTAGTTVPSTDIVIRGNTFDIGEGSYTQSIFMRNELVDSGKAGIDMYYRNVLIEDNAIYNGHLHGISVGETQGLTIRNNSLIAVADEDNPAQDSSALWVPTIRVASNSTGVTIEANAVASITGANGQPTWVMKLNAFIQNSDPHQPGYYKDVFIGSTMSGEDGAHHFVALPDSMIETLGAGAAATRFAEALTATSAFFTVDESADNGATRIFDASLTAQLLGDADKGASYTWTFGDGTTAEGKVVSHAFSAAGSYDVHLTVKLLDGSLRFADGDIDLNGSTLIAFDGKEGAFLAYTLGVPEELAPLSHLDGAAIQLGATGIAATVSRDALVGLRGSDDFTIDFTLKGDTVGGSGEVFRQHGSFIGSMTSTGQLSFQLFTADGKATTLSTTGLKLNDGAAHAIEIQLKDGSLEISVDGKVNTLQDVDGTLPTATSWDLTFGNPWGKANYAGDISAFTISVDKGDYPATPQTKILEADTSTGTSGDDGLPSDDEGSVDPVVTTTGMHAADWDGQVLDIAKLADNKDVLIDDAKVTTGPDGAVLHLDGDKDYAALGRQVAYETSDKVGFSVDFSRGAADGGQERLVWNHMNVGLKLVGDGLQVKVATADEGFKSYIVKDLGLNDTDLHRAEVMVDSANDRLQVVVDDQVVIDVDDADFEVAAAGGDAWGWTIGSAWDRFFEGEVQDFRLGDRFDFLEGYTPAEGALLT